MCVLKGVESLKNRSLSDKELLKKTQEYGKGRLAFGEIFRPESLSSVNLANAVRAFQDEGILQIHESQVEIKTSVWNQHKRDLKRILDVLNPT